MRLPLAVDWVHAAIPLAADIQSLLGLAPISNLEIEKKLIAYQQQFKLTKWGPSLQNYLNVKYGANDERH